MKFWIDLETRSPVPIKRGIAKYCQGVEIIMTQFAIGEGVPVVLDGPPPLEVCELARDSEEVWAHGAEFEQHVLAAACPAWDIAADRWRCTMALARMHGLPGGLDKLSTIFKLDETEAKDKRGRELIQLFCVPKKNGGYNDKRSHPKEWAEFRTYGAFDITSMRAVWRKCPKWNATPRMWRAWHLDQRINQRGVAVDLKLCEGAVKWTTKHKKRLADETEEATLGIVERTTQRNRMLAYFEEFGVSLPDLTADTVERRLEDESLPEHIKELLRIRQQASKTSTAKYQRALNQHVAGRLRNLLVFCGAARTGRWAGRTFQPQNLPRPKHKPWQIEQAIEAFRGDYIEMLYPDDVLGLGSSCLRGIMVAEEGNKLVVADLANIEGRMCAWIAGEDWKLTAFRQFDQKLGPDLYKVAYARSFAMPDPRVIADEGDQRRQIGKVMELSLQYYGGVGAFCSMADTYGLRLDELADAAWPVIPDAVRKRAVENWQRARKRRRTYGLDERVWCTCEALVLLWRAAHPAIVAFWEAIEKAVKRALITPNKAFPAGRVSVDRLGNWLRIRLPSGRYLSYPAPRNDEDAHQLSFVGVNPYTRQWGRIGTYSGKLTENIVQGASADMLIDGMVACDEAGYNPVLSVHDELVTEPRDVPEFTDKGLSKLMVESSPWAAGMPLAAKGFTAYRYAKR